jgi:hypothetical protein
VTVSNCEQAELNCGRYKYHSTTSLANLELQWAGSLRKEALGQMSSHPSSYPSK